MIAEMDATVEAGQASFRALILLLITVPGVGQLAARTILAEIGRDMSRFPTVGHLLSWAGLCPRNNESAGKHRTRPRPAKWCKSRPANLGEDRVAIAT